MNRLFYDNSCITKRGSQEVYGKGWNSFLSTKICKNCANVLHMSKKITTETNFVVSFCISWKKDPEMSSYFEKSPCLLHFHFSWNKKHHLKKKIKQPILIKINVHSNKQKATPNPPETAATFFRVKSWFKRSDTIVGCSSVTPVR